MQDFWWGRRIMAKVVRALPSEVLLDSYIDEKLNFTRYIYFVHWWKVEFHALYLLFSLSIFIDIHEEVKAAFAWSQKQCFKCRHVTTSVASGENKPKKSSFGSEKIRFRCCASAVEVALLDITIVDEWCNVTEKNAAELPRKYHRYSGRQKQFNDYMINLYFLWKLVLP